MLKAALFGIYCWLHHLKSLWLFTVLSLNYWQSVVIDAFQVEGFSQPFIHWALHRDSNYGHVFWYVTRLYHLRIRIVLLIVNFCT